MSSKPIHESLIEARQNAAVANAKLDPKDVMNPEEVKRRFKEVLSKVESIEQQGKEKSVEKSKGMSK